MIKYLVPPTRIERAARGLGNRCSIRLSYGGNKSYVKDQRVSSTILVLNINILPECSDGTQQT